MVWLKNGFSYSFVRHQEACMQTPLNRIISAGFAVALFAVGDGAHAHDSPVPFVSVDLPHGGCMLTIGKDGEASISYGSTPKWVRVAPHTFDFDRIVRLLQARSYPQRDLSLRSESVGTLSLPGSQDLRFINDSALIRSLLERAWKARVAPVWPSDNEDYRWVASVCSFT